MRDKNICKIIILIVSFILVLSLIACSKKEEEPEVPVATPAPTMTPTATPTPTEEPTPTPDPHIGEVRSQISGKWIPVQEALNRPFCIMFNNIAVASPQSGISEADILYEALAEAGISRLMGVFEKIDENSSMVDRIGSVRSARHYFASFADEYDPIFIHYGETKYAAKKIDKLGMNDIDGITGIGDYCFYRDKTIKAPHNAFASLEGIKKAIEKSGFQTTHTRETESHFGFYDEDTDIVGEDAEYIGLNYSSYMSPYMVYSPEEKLYYRYQFDAQHIDYNTGEPISFKNVIIMVVNESNIDKNGYQTMEIEKNTGHGYYITNGKRVEITWEKNEKQHFCRYYDAAGSELKINEGKTFISVFPDFREEKLTFSKPE